VWLSGDLLVKLNGKKEMNRQWKQGQESEEECRTRPGCVGMGSGGPRHK